jgi:acyl-coenzyme A thioesterase PaaI-like protein
MRHAVTAKQPNSKMCLVCGLKNDFGLHASFYELDNGDLLGVFTPGEQHQGYPGRLHGGIVTAILDETVGRSILTRGPEIWGVTVEFNIRFRKPVPLGEEIRVVGRITKETPRSFEGAGEILLPDGSTAVEGRGKFIKLPIENIAETEHDDLEWRVIPSDDDPTAFDL